MECTLFNQEEIHVATAKIWIFVTHMHYGTNAVLNLCDLELIILLIICINILGFHCETILHVYLFIWHNMGMAANDHSESVFHASHNSSFPISEGCYTAWRGHALTKKAKTLYTEGFLVSFTLSMNR